ncbi:MAG: hypothetical protein LBH03_05950 [Holophagales bacterium]|jgi:hypothetical protein|nr:hypothetical protein [Holophagales bacterium]
MAIVTIQASALSNAQKKRVGERVLDSLHREGIPASSIVVLFRNEDTDIFLDGGLLFETKPHVQAVSVTASAPVSPVSAAPAKAAPTFTKEPAVTTTVVRKPIPEYLEVKEKVRSMLLDHGGLSSFQAQSGLDLKGYDGASAMLRRVFAELEAEGIVEKQGQKRGTRYVLKGITSAPPQQSTPVILVKQDKSDVGTAGNSGNIGY